MQEEGFCLPLFPFCGYLEVITPYSGRNVSKINKFHVLSLYELSFFPLLLWEDYAIID
jgi:hypothetical protein